MLSLSTSIRPTNFQYVPASHLPDTQDLQVGAAFAVLLTPKSEGSGLPLELQAAKCRVLHTEPAAGAVGLMSLVARLRGSSAPGVMIHLRGMNPYVASAFQVGAAEIHNELAAPIAPRDDCRGY